MNANERPVRVQLETADGRTIKLLLTPLPNGGFREELITPPEVADGHGETVRAKIGHLTVDGEAWRFLEGNGLLEVFVERTVQGTEDPVDFMETQASRLGKRYGKILYPHPF